MHADADLLERLNGTAAVDGHGRPLVLHHGTFAVFDRFAETRDIGYHFGTRAQAGDRRRGARQEQGAPRRAEWRLVSAALAVRNPLRLTHDPRVWKASYVAMQCAHAGALGVAERRRVDAAYAEALADARAAVAAEIARRETDGRPTTGTNYDRVWDPIWAQHNAKALAVLRGLLEERGIDGIVYDNEHEGRAEAVRAASWVAFRPEAIHILGVGLVDDHLMFDPAVAQAVGFAPGANPTLVPTDPEARKPGNRPLTKAVQARLQADLVAVLAAAGGQPSADPGWRARGAWEVASPLGPVRLVLTQDGRVNAALPGLSAEAKATAWHRLSGLDDTSTPEGGRVGWSFDWQVGERFDRTLARLGRLLEALPALGDRADTSDVPGAVPRR